MIARKEVSDFFTDRTGIEVKTGDEHLITDLKLTLFQLVKLFLAIEKYFSITFSRINIKQAMTFNEIYKCLEEAESEQFV